MVGFPLLLIPIALYNAIAFLMPSVAFTDALFSLTLVSGARWPVTLSDILLTLGVLLLLLEVIKGARPGAKYLTDHLLSLVVFGGAAAEFVMWPKFASSTFFLLTLIAMTDFLTGIALRTHRRSVPAAAGEPASQAQSTSVPDSTGAVAPVEPKFDPTPPSSPQPAAEPASALPAAASIAESVLMDHPEPKIAHVVVAREPNVEPPSEPTESNTESKREPKIPSPELQPATGPLGAQEQ